MKKEEVVPSENPTKTGWNYHALITTLFAIILLESVFFPCLCYIGDAKMIFAIIINSFFILRIAFARIRKEKNEDWKIYLLLIILSPFFIHFYFHH